MNNLEQKLKRISRLVKGNVLAQVIVEKDKVILASVEKLEDEKETRKRKVKEQNYFG
ncbi:MAG: hypothetical protein QME12_09295 [Nanoarchaeota archaeon]|nr:hypothetical protein [Nanoarchaeota archaeon]